MKAQRILLTVLLFTSGLCGISYEILYGRLLGNIIGDQFVVSTAVLLTFLLGIGLGALHAHRLWSRLWLIEAGIGLYAAFFHSIFPALNRCCIRICPTSAPARLHLLPQPWCFCWYLPLPLVSVCRYLQAMPTN